MTEIARPATGLQRSAAPPPPDALMPYDDAKMLLAAAAVIDHRRPDKLAITEWQYGLRGLAGEECLEALRRFRATDTGTTYLVPGILREWVMELRRERAYQAKIAAGRQLIDAARRGEPVDEDALESARYIVELHDRRQAEIEERLARGEPIDLGLSTA